MSKIYTRIILKFQNIYEKYATNLQRKNNRSYTTNQEPECLDLLVATLETKR